ncbi:NADH:flavorubredoxin reductase NorW [Plesiomonas shigelloides]|uniref:NADH:flavorubredoxin reductase NorW n=1 Tax=Plesiomonas shigelloides TaxID=703 RepID=A0A8I1W498_PLESH|nr:NADH:flavorubredoxin reductase NorW [Plesiomonas shigelloides]MBO1106821.1 NADH:flavorubredoxin reductase NorW [Plesiomonas shigelloides]
MPTLHMTTPPAQATPTLVDAPIIIVGSGFAAWQLVKAMRRQNAPQPILLITADDGCDYNKPDLSHIFTRQTKADSMVRADAATLAAELNIEILTQTRVTALEPKQHLLHTASATLRYSKLVLAVGAHSVIPPLPDDAAQHCMTLNSLQDYRQHAARLQQMPSVLIVGGGLIGTELGMDAALAGKQVIMTDLAPRLLARQLPALISQALQQQMQEHGVRFKLGCTLTALQRSDSGEWAITFSDGSRYQAAEILCTAGLRPEITLAQRAGLHTDRGIVTDAYLATSEEDIFALGDCAQVAGEVYAYLQPILLCAAALAKTLLGQPTAVRIPTQSVRVKTPLLPLQIAGTLASHLASEEVGTQQIVLSDPKGMTLWQLDAEQKRCGFVAAGEHQKQAMAMLKMLGQPFEIAPH